MSAIVMIGIVLAVGGCGVAPGSSGRSPSDTSTPARNYGALPVVSPEVDAAIFAKAKLPAWAIKAKIRPERNGLQDGCNATLASDGQSITAEGATWMDAARSLILEQYVMGYGWPIAENAVREAAAALTCGSYNSRDLKITEDGTMNLTAPASGEIFGYCDVARPIAKGGIAVSRCTIDFGMGSIACSVRLWAHSKNAAIDGMRALVPLIEESCKG